MSTKDTEAGRPGQDDEPLALRLTDLLGPLPERAVRDIANGLNGVQPKLAQWRRDLMLARAVAAAVVAAERERCAAIAREVADGCTDCDAHDILQRILKA